MFLATLFLLIAGIQAGRLEPDPSVTGVYLGSWWCRLYGGGDTPLRTNNRVGVRPFSLWQGDFNISSTVQSADLNQIIEQIEETKTDALAMLTIYPVDGMDAVSDAALNDLASRLAKFAGTGRRIMIRYGSEMNGCWFKYGQQPAKFVTHYRKVVDTIRTAAGKYSDNIAFVWGPNSANGYPFQCEVNYGVNDTLLDTNGNGRLDNLDDPYTPYYPGDDYVDWVGLSLYHYGDTYPWVQNLMPAPGKAEAIMTGQRPFGHFNFYEMFSGSGAGGQPQPKSKGGKPFIITETGAPTHLWVKEPNKPGYVPDGTDPDTRARIKQAWWRQMINADFLAKFPKVRAIQFFEYIKPEETSFRDFTMMGPA
ncbi:glycoside hydrolase superfamily, partial [Globomyces pollinis-pini]